MHLERNGRGGESREERQKGTRKDEEMKEGDGEEEMNVMDEDETESERGTKARSDAKTCEDRETDDHAAVSTGPYGMFLFSVRMSSTVVTNHFTQ